MDYPRYYDIKKSFTLTNKSWSELNLKQQSTEEWDDQIHLGSLIFKLFSVIKKNKCGASLFYKQTLSILARSFMEEKL